MRDPAVLPLSICLFGPFEARLDGVPLPRLRSRKGQWLLALLTLRAGAEVERAWLTGTLWPDHADRQASVSLRASLADLRRALGPEAGRLRSSTPHTLCLDLAGAEADVVAFDRAVARGDEAALEEAVALHRGPLLEGCQEEWLFQERQVREQACLTALEKLAAAALDRGDVGTAEGYLRRAVAIDPLRETAQRVLMQGLAAAGNYAAVLQTYRELRVRLHQELNAEPDPETQALFQQLRAEARARAGIRAEPSFPEPRPPTPDPRLPSGTVTFLFTDIEGSTRLWDEQPEAMRQALTRHDALAASIIDQHGGTLLKTRGEGDSLFAVFARATDALAAATALQKALSSEAWPTATPLCVRMALHTGEADQRDDDYYGPAVNRGARLRAAGHGGQVLLSQATQTLVREALPEGTSLRDLGAHRLRDLQQPEHLFQLLHPALPADFPPLRSLAAFAHNLPVQLTRFIGREREWAAVKRLLAASHLLTLTGSGGCGKTRLALQVAADLLEEYADGVWLVELAALADPALVPQTVVSALGVREEPGRSPTETLLEYLRPRHLLLVVDNCEHLLAACASLADTLLRSCPHLRVLASSREGLGIAGEQTYRVPSLSVPDGQQRASPARLQEYEAVQLFADRAALSQPAFAVTAANAAAVVRVCQRLDGIPLAIELAAARAKALPVEQIAARLDDRFRLLTGGSRTALPRQQTLRALIDWSYDLLTDPERALLRRLSVFSGGWTLEAAEAVCTGDSIEEWAVLDRLTTLVEKSLVGYEERGGEGRYRLLETVRQYARERLLEAGEAEAVRRRHRDWYLALAERAEPELFRGEQAVWLDRLEADHDNLRAALDWSVESGETEAALRLGGSIWRFWHIRGYRAEGRERLTRVLSRPEASAPTAIRAKALDGAGVMASTSGHREEGRAFYEEELAIGRALEDRHIIATAFNGLGEVALFSGDNATAQAYYEESLENSRPVGDKWNMAFSLVAAGNAIRYQGDLETPRSLYAESAALFRELNDRRGITMPLFCMAFLAQGQGDHPSARSLWEEGLAILRELDDRERIAWCLKNLGDVARFQGDYKAARACYEEILAIQRGLGERSNKAGVAEALIGLASVAQGQGDHPAARALLEEAQALSREIGDKGVTSGVCMGLGHLLLELGDYAAARSRYEEGLALRRATGDTRDIAWGLLEVGHAAWLQGECVVTQSHAVEALGLFQSRDDKDGLLAALESLAVAALAKGRKEHAARLLGAVEALREALKLPGADWWRRPGERIRETVRAAFVEQEFAAEWAEGRALSLDQTVADALDHNRTAAGEDKRRRR